MISDSLRKSTDVISAHDMSVTVELDPNLAALVLTMSESILNALRMQRQQQTSMDSRLCDSVMSITMDSLHHEVEVAINAALAVCEANDALNKEAQS